MKRSIGAAGRGAIRPGLISLLTVVVILSLSTISVLTIATSNAMAALSERQASMTSQGYDAETSAQTMLALMDDTLQNGKASSVAGATRLLDKSMEQILAKACVEGVTATHEAGDSSITCTFVTNGGRMLQTQIDITGKDTYDVVSWKLTAAPQDEDSDDTLWTGPAAQE